MGALRQALEQRSECNLGRIGVLHKAVVLGEVLTEDP